MKKPTNRVATKSATPERQLTGFIAKFEPRHQTLIRQVRAALRKRLRTAHELVYDNYNFFVIGYSPSERPSDAILSIAAGASGVGLCFLRGATLPDPARILLGSGKQTRFIRLDSVNVLDEPAVRALVDAAVKQSRVPLRSDGTSRLIIRSISAKQKPRRRQRQNATKS
jgi:hypothetical protein